SLTHLACGQWQRSRNCRCHSRLLLSQMTGSTRMVADTGVRAAARRLGLKYLSPDTAPIRRREYGKGFCYIDQEGNIVRVPQVRARIQRLVIPPAWEDVRIA